VIERPASRFVSAKAFSIVLAAALTCVLVLVAKPRVIEITADSVSYRDFALGHVSTVMASIAGRFLHPMMVRGVSLMSGANIGSAFFGVAIVSLVTLALALSMMIGSFSSPWLAPAIVFAPVLATHLFGLYYTQDLFHAGLAAVFFCALLYRRTGLALLVLFALYLTRESTIVLGAVLAIGAALRSNRRMALWTAAVSIVGYAISRHAASFGMPNVHHVNEFVFLAMKVPFDLTRTVLGVILVPNTVRGNPGFTCAPVMIWSLPAWLRFGELRDCGVCRPDIALPLHTFGLALTLFGIGPVILAKVLLSHWRKIALEAPLWVFVAVAYGVLIYLVSPAVSFWLERDFGYAWPAFWIATPWLLSKYYALERAQVLKLLGANLAVCWIPRLVGMAPDQLLAPTIAIIGALAVDYIALRTFVSCRRRTTAMPLEVGLIERQAVG
jgi:uncharacterized protein (DUF983 family)